jgi:Cu/Ag efflux protein CusF
MNIEQLNDELNAMALKGDMITAVSNYFAEQSVTKDHTGSTITDKAAHLAKMESFLGGIDKVNGITLHHVGIADNVSFNEFTFDFDMKDASKILWHEVIRRIWADGKVTEEQYFIA